MKYQIIILLLCIAALSILLAGCTSLSIRTSVVINAPVEFVYSTLADFASYPNWNPYHRKIDGEFKEGAKLTVHVTRPDGKAVKVPPHMMRIKENEEITWGGGVKGVFYGVHRFTLVALPEGQTILKQDEDFSGFALNFVDLPPNVLAEGYQQMNLALKTKLETNNE